MNILTKNLVLAVSILGLGTAVAGAQQTSAPPATATVATNVVGPIATNAVGPKIQFATPLYDFGRARAGEPVKYTYVFTNTGDRLLILNSVQPQCGCTTAGEWTKQVEPGKTGTIPIQFNTASYNGPVFKQVTVSCNVTSQPTLFVQLKGTVYRPFDLLPNLAVLTVLADSDAATASVTITNNTEEPLSLFPPESANRMFAAQLKTNVPGKSFQLTVSTVPPLSGGNVQGQINLKTSWTNTPVISVTAVANVQAPITVIPPHITLAPGPLANAVTNSVSIQNFSTNLLQLSEPVVNVPGVTAQIKATQPGRSYLALLEFPEGFELPQGKQVELSIKSSNPKLPVVKVPVMQLPKPVMQPAKPAPVVPVVAPVAPGRQAPPRPPLPPMPVKPS